MKRQSKFLTISIMLLFVVGCSSSSSTNEETNETEIEEKEPEQIAITLSYDQTDGYVRGDMIEYVDGVIEVPDALKLEHQSLGAIATYNVQLYNEHDIKLDEYPEVVVLDGSKVSAISTTTLETGEIEIRKLIKIEIGDVYILSFPDDSIPSVKRVVGVENTLIDTTFIDEDTYKELY